MGEDYYPSGPFVRRLSDNSTFELLREDFLLDFGNKATARAYKADLQDFKEWCTTNGIDPIKPSPEQITTYIRSLATRGYSASTASRRLSVLRRFFSHLVQRAQLDLSPVEAFSVRDVFVVLEQHNLDDG